MKRVCEELKEGRGSLRLRYKSFQRRVISLEIEKRFRRFPLTFSSSSSSKKDFPFPSRKEKFLKVSSSLKKKFSTSFPLRNPKGKVFNVVLFIWKSKKVFDEFFFSK